MNIKKGDLVMVVRPSPCCGNINAIGITFIAMPKTSQRLRCAYCAALTTTGHFLNSSTGYGYPPSRLKKIDPPSEGDSLPTRKDIEVPA